jgi:hypothetical protein
MPCAVAGTNHAGARHRDRAEGGGIFVNVFMRFGEESMAFENAIHQQRQNRGRLLFRSGCLERR